MASTDLLKVPTDPRPDQEQERLRARSATVSDDSQTDSLVAEGCSSEDKGEIIHFVHFPLGGKKDTELSEETLIRLLHDDYENDRFRVYSDVDDAPKHGTILLVRFPSPDEDDAETQDVVQNVVQEAVDRLVDGQKPYVLRTDNFDDAIEAARGAMAEMTTAPDRVVYFAAVPKVVVDDVDGQQEGQ